MRNFSYKSLAAILACALLATPIWANNPFEDTTVTVQSSSTTESEEIADTATTEDSAAETKAAAPEVKSENKEGIITAGALNVRNAPWGDVLGTIHKDDKVQITGSMGDWYIIDFNGKTGYIYSSWVTTDDKQGITKATYGTVVSGQNLSIRRVPSGDIIGEYEPGTKVYILGEVGDWYKIKYNNNEAFVLKKYVDVTGKVSASTAPATQASTGSFTKFTGYCTASTLNVRASGWGTVVGYLYNGNSVTITGEDGDWYKCDFKGTTRYVSKKYISKTKPTGSSSSSSSSNNYSNAGSSSATGNATSAQSGTLQERVVSCARALVGSTNFRGNDVSGGRLACAKVATTALKNAGALDSVVLNCRSAVKNLKAKGWVEVSVPPYQEGDVITWKTYDYTGDGVKDEDTHIGIILKEGNTYKAMNNSSSLRTPRISEINIAPISRVLRKVN